MEGVQQTAPPKLTEGRKDLGPLTGIRFFAAFYVVVFHSRVGAVCLQRGWYALGNFFQNGYLAVALFFLLSGFILAYTYEGRVANRSQCRRFWEARFARLWPVYALSLFFAALPPMHSAPHPKVMVATLLMVQSWNPFDLGMAGAWNAVCWTLSTEALFYLLFPWLMRMLEGLESWSQFGWTVLMLSISVATNSAVHTLGYPAKGIARFVPLAVYHLPEFGAGVGLGSFFLGRTWQTGGRPREGVARRFGVLTYISLACTILVLCQPSGRWTSLVVVSFVALLYGLATEATLVSRFLSSRTMILGGGISYTMYLMQTVVKFWVEQGAVRLHLGNSLRLPLNAVLLIAISYVIFEWIENPARFYLRSVFARIEQRRATALARGRNTP